MGTVRVAMGPYTPIVVSYKLLEHSESLSLIHVTHYMLRLLPVLGRIHNNLKASRAFNAYNVYGASDRFHWLQVPSLPVAVIEPLPVATTRGQRWPECTHFFRAQTNVFKKIDPHRDDRLGEHWQCGTYSSCLGTQYIVTLIP